jgi:[acyl-carrier-protein] S-malonyltransferase
MSSGMGFAIVFAGQGMQHAAMLPWLAHDDLVERTRSELGVGDWRARLEDPVWASRNTNAQILLTGLNLAAWTQLSRALPRPAAVAGYSVGELASFAAAGVFDSGTAVWLAGTRARAMDRCAAIAPGGLLAVSGLPPGRIERLCTDTGVTVAIDNDLHAVVLGGMCPALNAAEQAAQGAGAHCTRLKVDVASHTPWMQAAADEFMQALSTLPLRAPSVPLFANAADRITSAAQAAGALASQIAQTVHWRACMDHIHARQVGCVLEVGPGAALARMWNQRFPDIPARSVDEFRSASAIVDWVRRKAGG